MTRRELLKLGAAVAVPVTAPPSLPRRVLPPEKWTRFRAASPPGELVWRIVAPAAVMAGPIGTIVVEVVPNVPDPP